jgi:hypothetical protein
MVRLEECREEFDPWHLEQKHQGFGRLLQVPQGWLQGRPSQFCLRLEHHRQQGHLVRMQPVCHL